MEPTFWGFTENLEFSFQYYVEIEIAYSTELEI